MLSALITKHWPLMWRSTHEAVRVENLELRDVACKLHRKLCDEMKLRIEREPGAYVVGGRLFFKLPSRASFPTPSAGSTIGCNCIGEPYASEIAALFVERRK